jgi:methylisocitrate lyase
MCAGCAAGGGNVLNVQRTVKQLINVGAKGCFLEDQRWPKRVGHMRNKEVISMEEFAGKVRHALPPAGILQPAGDVTGMTASCSSSAA